MTILLRDISKHYPGTIALTDITLEIEYGRVYSIVGENGAGKSTLMNIMSGSVQPTSGGILVEGKQVILESPASALSHGISLVSQEGSLVPSLTGSENICLGSEPRTVFGRIRKSELNRSALALRDRWFPGSEVNLQVPVGELPYADQKIVEILRALYCNPRVLILDEPTATLSAREKHHLWKVIKALPLGNVSVILISHFLPEVVDLSDDVVVLRDGRKISHLRRGRDAIAEHVLIDLMLNKTSQSKGDPWSVVQKKEVYSPFPDTPIIRARKWAGPGFTVDDFSIQRGEIIGLIGLTGAGHFEFARSLFEPRTAMEGEYFYRDLPVSHARVPRMKSLGVAFVPDHRMINALVAEWNVRENMSLAGLTATAYKHTGVINRINETSETQRLMKQLRLKAPAPSATITALSGGNKQKVSISRWLFAGGRYDLFIFVEPTEGVDVGAKREIHALIEELAQSGAAVVVASSDLLEVAYLSHRVIPFRLGIPGAPFSRQQFGEAAFINAIAGVN